MKYLYELLDSLSRTRRLTKSQKLQARELFPEMVEMLDTRQSIPGFKLASGQTARGATGRIALNAYYVLLGRAVYGPQFIRQDKLLYTWTHELAFNIMYGYFHGRTERGLYCCPSCTLSVYPLYCMNAIHWFNCTELKERVRARIERREGFFKNVTTTNKYVEWALRFS